MEFTELGPDFYRIVLKYGFMQEVDVPAGWSVMEGAVKNLIPGIDAGERAAIERL